MLMFEEGQSEEEGDDEVDTKGEEVEDEEEDKEDDDQVPSPYSLFEQFLVCTIWILDSWLCCFVLASCFFFFF